MTVQNATYQEIPGLLATRTPFSGNSAAGFWDDDNVFCVTSYGTLIAWSNPAQNGFSVSGFSVPDRRYSRTTSRIQNLCRASV